MKEGAEEEAAGAKEGFELAIREFVGFWLIFVATEGSLELLIVGRELEAEAAVVAASEDDWLAIELDAWLDEERDFDTIAAPTGS